MEFWERFERFKEKVSGRPNFIEGYISYEHLHTILSSLEVGQNIMELSVKARIHPAYYANKPVEETNSASRVLEYVLEFDLEMPGKNVRVYRSEFSGEKSIKYLFKLSKHRELRDLEVLVSFNKKY